MQTPDRLAAYLADELEPADRAALEDELARDGQLRAALAAMRRADAALSQLDTPTPGAGFDARMDAFVDDFLAELDVDDPATDAPRDTPPSPHDARADANRSGWVLAIAAAMILLVGVGVATLQPFGGDDAISGRAELSSIDDQAAGEATTESMDAMDEAGPLALPLQPLIVDDERTLTDEELDALLDEAILREVAGAQLDRDQGTEVGLELQRQLGQAAPDVTDDGDVDADPDTADDGDVAADTEDSGGAEVAPRPNDSLITRSGDPVDEQLLADAQRCLATLLEAGPTAIPVYVELLTVGQQQALVFGLVTIDPQDDGFTRREIWTLDRGTCQVLRFAQA